jgi:hypothetical protein
MALILVEPAARLERDRGSERGGRQQVLTDEVGHRQLHLSAKGRSSSLRGTSLIVYLGDKVSRGGECDRLGIRERGRLARERLRATDTTAKR